MFSRSDFTICRGPPVATAPPPDIAIVAVAVGEAPTPELITELVEKARAVQGVRDVESLLHLPGTPAPMHE